jgi:hypothetical protein
MARKTALWMNQPRRRGEPFRKGVDEIIESPLATWRCGLFSYGRFFGNIPRPANRCWTRVLGSM